MIVTSNAIAFINTLEANVYPYFCELNFLEDGPKIVQTAAEFRPQNVFFIYVTTSDGHLVQFTPKISGVKDSIECKLTAMIDLPIGFESASLSATKGAVILQNNNQILMIDTSQASLQQTPIMQTYELSTPVADKIEPSLKTAKSISNTADYLLM